MTSYVAQVIEYWVAPRVGGAAAIETAHSHECCLFNW